MAGQHINDHSFFGGAKPHGEVFPKGNKVKDMTSAEGFGALHHYEDTSEAIHSQQEMNKKKVHGHPQKPGHRN